MVKKQLKTCLGYYVHREMMSQILDDWELGMWDVSNRGNTIHIYQKKLKKFHLIKHGKCWL